MAERLLLHNNSTSSYSLESIQHSLEAIHTQLLFEIKVKQESLQLLVEKVSALENMLNVKDQKIEELTAELEVNRRISEGNRQLVNKLLNDIDRLQQDVEWYKRTYESRSLLGTLKEKVLGSHK